MYKNLNSDALGISGRQSELIELALTHKFSGLDLDLAPLCRQVQSRGLEHARRFLDSAKLKIGGFEFLSVNDNPGPGDFRILPGGRYDFRGSPQYLLQGDSRLLG